MALIIDYTTRSANGHSRSYIYGDICCVNCNKWIRPSDPHDAEQIVYNRKGKRFHDRRYCPIRSIGPSAFSTSPRNKTAWRLMYDDSKRY